MTASAAELSALLRQIEDLLRFPGAIGHGASVKQLALSIARQAPTPTIELLALQLAEAAPAGAEDVQASKALWKLREALQNLG
jgi:hypothetical protein